MLGTDEFSGVTKALAPVGKVERRRVAVEGRGGVAWFSLNLLEEGALELGVCLAATQLTSLLVILVQPFLETLSDVFDIFINEILLGQITVSWREGRRGRGGSC